MSATEERWADLHLHTNFSDGALSPEKVIDLAARAGLAAVAVTDHDCTDGVLAAAAAGRECGVEVIPGVELSAEKEGREVHILGYGVDVQNPVFLGRLESWRRERIERARKIVARLNEMNIPLEYGKVEEVALRGVDPARSPFKMVGRLHVAVALLESGFVRNTGEAFARFLGDGRPACVAKDRVPTGEAFTLVHEAGGIAVLAHPGDLSKDEWIEGWRDEGMDGLEVYHTKHSPGTSRRYAQLAERYGLLTTGGSDCHGAGPDRILIGTVRVPYEMVEKMKERIKARA